MFAKLFGKKEKMDPAKEKELEKKKNDLQIKESQNSLEKKIQENERKIEIIEQKIKNQTKLALDAKKAGQKSKALRLLGEIKKEKAKVVKISGYNTMLQKQMGNIDSIAIDTDMMDIIKDTNKVMEQQQKNQEENMEILQDAIAINQEMEYNQDEINQLINTQNEDMNADLEEDFNALDELDVLDAIDDYDVNTNTNTNKQPQQKVQNKKETNYDSMLNDLLN
jgi:hypothetical protein